MIGIGRIVGTPGLPGGRRFGVTQYGVHVRLQGRQRRLVGSVQIAGSACMMTNGRTVNGKKNNGDWLACLIDVKTRDATSKIDGQIKSNIQTEWHGSSLTGCRRVVVASRFRRVRWSGWLLDGRCRRGSQSADLNRVGRPDLPFRSCRATGADGRRTGAHVRIVS